MNELICPFCNQKLEPIGTSGQFQCGTWGCKASFNFIATRDVWEYIGRTRKALDVAVDALKWVHETYNLGMGYEAAIMEKCEFALEQITALTKGGNSD